ncbi:acyl-CoA thioesterase [Nocardiopsis rhodophaea]|uniref:Acyl-CoA thioesterase n=1 Tax=Nocardiopsis rhodophaea TaxID=280238 RepID=A0ABN2SFJ3_9ACTN
MKYFEYLHTVSFEETNTLGNVYFSHFLRWQGRCREQFLWEHVPTLVAALDNSAAMVTTRCSCEYMAELAAFDRIAVRMRAGDVTQSRLTLLFDYVRLEPGGAERTAAKGEQQLAWMRWEDGHLVPDRVPGELLSAIDTVAGDAGAWRR